MCVWLQVGKTRDAIGLDGEVVNRRRTISGPVTELVAAAKRTQPTASTLPSPSVQPETSLPVVNNSCHSPQPPSSPHPSSGGSGSSSENLPFAEEGSLTIRRQGRGEGEGQVDIYKYYLYICAVSTCCFICLYICQSGLQLQPDRIYSNYLLEIVSSF